MERDLNSDLSLDWIILENTWKDTRDNIIKVLKNSRFVRKGGKGGGERVINK